MAEFRIKNGLALGPFGGDIAYIGGAGSVNQLLFAQANGTPDVSLSPLYFTNNTSTTVYSYFTASRPGFATGAEEPPDGKVVIVMFKDDSSTVTNQQRMFLSTTLGTFQSGGVLGLICVGSAWYELFRSTNYRASDTTRTEIASYNVAGSASFDVTFARVVVATATAAGTVIVSFSGGQAYQRLTLMPVFSAASTLFINGDSGNISLAGTGSMILSNSGAYDFILNPKTSRWELIKGSAAV